MPKIKEVAKNVKHGIENAARHGQKMSEQITNDKYERADNCFNKLSEENIKLCFSSTGKEISSYDQLQGITIGRPDPINENFSEYCLSELRNVGVVKCSELPAYKEHIVGAATDAAENAAETLKQGIEQAAHLEL